MPRQAREKGEFSIYHVIQRGNERKNIFLSDDDKVRSIEILLNTKKKYSFLLYAYCLFFRNELIRETRKNTSLTLKQIGELFGGLSVSRVSRILAQRGVANQEPSPFARW